MSGSKLGWVGFSRLLADSIGILLGLLIVAGLSLALGGGLLDGPFRGDSPMHVAYATWLDRQLPNIPHWFPLHGAGVSLLHGYPVLPHLLVAGLGRFLALSVGQAYLVFSFTGFVLQGIGIFLLGRFVLKRTSIGILASVFFLISPISWTWMADWGFFSQHVGFIFLPLILLTFHQALANQQQDGPRWQRRLWLASLSALLVLAALSHVLVASAAALVMLLCIVGRTLATPAGLRNAMVRGSIRLLGALAVLSLLIGAAYLVPFLKYGQYANRDGLNILPPHLIPRVPVAEALGIRAIDSTQVLSRMQFSLVVTIFAGIGILSAITGRRFKGLRYAAEFPMALAALCCMIYSLTPGLWSAMYSVSTFVSRLVSFRSSLIGAMVLVPLLAGFGVYILIDWAIAWALSFVRSQGGEDVRDGLRPQTRQILTSLMSLGLAGAVIIPITGMPVRTAWERDIGPRRVDLRDIWDQRADDPCTVTGSARTVDESPLCRLEIARKRLNIAEFQFACDQLASSSAADIPDLCQMSAPSSADVAGFVNWCNSARRSRPPNPACTAMTESLLAQISPNNWPSLELAPPNSLSDASLRWEGLIDNSKWTRMDLSPNLGGLAQYLAVYLEVPQLPAYTHQLALNHAIWGYQLGVFYTQAEYSQFAMRDLAEWYGIGYVLLNAQMDDAERFSREEWEVRHQDEQIILIESLDDHEAASVLSTPTVLVMGDKSGSVYHDVFRLATEGLAPYGDFLIADGSVPIDEFELDELVAFDVLILHGYWYKNASAAWELLEAYVRRGGGLFIDTGWQFKIPQWEFEHAPDVLPVGKLTWTNYGKVETYELQGEDISFQIGADDIEPLVWEDQAWGVSGAPASSIKEWAFPVLSVKGEPLIAAGRLGEGRVVWSGMNFISHMNAYQSLSERVLLTDLIAWLADGSTDEGSATLMIQRSSPDDVSIAVQAISGGRPWLLWRESYYPNWRAMWIEPTGQEAIPIYRAGPGLMLMPIPHAANEGTVSITWQTSALDKVAYIGSLLGLFALLALITDGLAFRGEGFRWLKIALLVRFPRPFLGEGSNTEWAEKMQDEIVSGSRRPKSEPDLSDTAPETVRSRDGNTVLHRPGTSHGRRNAVMLPVDSEQTEEDARLLQKWMESSGHQEDAWAEKLIRRRSTPKDNC